jgi:hypothetical protein
MYSSDTLPNFTGKEDVIIVLSSHLFSEGKE